MEYILILLCTIYLVACLYMYVRQRKLLFLPEKVEDFSPQTYGLDMEVIETETEDGLKLRHWLKRPPSKDAPLVVYFHGNASFIGTRKERAEALIELGYGVLLVEYRGYGANPGSPTEKGFVQDARSVLDFLRENDYHQNVILFGESIGSGVAVQIAADTDIPYKAVILAVPFSSALDVAKQMYPYLPISLLMKDKFNSMDYIADIKAPLLVMHGTADNTIPVDLGMKLFDAAPEPKTLEIIDGARHSTIFDFELHKPVGAFVSSLATAHKA